MPERERAAASLRFLAEASEKLSESLGYDLTLSRVTRLVVPDLADWCTVDQLDDDGRIHRVAAAHADPTKDALLHETFQQFPIRLDEPRGVAIALRTGQTLIQPEVTDEEVRTVARDARHLEILREPRPRSHLIVPLISHGQRLGALSLLYSDDSGRRYADADRALVEDLARRCAQAVENAQLYRAVSEAEGRVRVLDAELEQRVDERTRQLRHAQEELETTNQGLVDLAAELEDRVAQRTAELEEKSDEVRAMSQQLWQAAKLATMGELAASIAHELNNPLGTISLRIESLLARTPADHPNHRALSIVEQEVARMAGLVSNLLHFSRSGGTQVSTVDVREELANTLELMHYHLRNHGIVVVRELSASVPLIHADRQRFRQLFLNLFTNATDAMPEGGTLTLRVAEAALQQCEAEAVAVMLPAESGDALEVAVVGGSYPAELVGTRVPLDRDGVSWLVRQHEPRSLDAAAAALPRPVPESESVVSVPMLAGGRLVGVLNVSVECRWRPLTPGQLKALTLLTGAAAAALESASLYEAKQAEERARLVALERAARAEVEVERSARVAAEQALSIRDEFLSVAAHELKTPITSLLGAAQLLIRHQETALSLAPSQMYRSAQIIDRQARRLSRLVTQLLESSRLDAGQFVPNRSLVNLTSLVTTAVEQARGATDRHEIVLTAPPRVLAHVDGTRIEQVVGNLLDNAIKFSPDGGRIEVELATPSDGAIRLTVRDYGIGISPWRRHELFTRYYQAHAESHRSGLGLGLYVSRCIVEQHGGRIDVEFPANAGSRFVVQVPTGVKGAEAALAARLLNETA